MHTHAHTHTHTHTHTHNPLQLDIHCTSIALLRGLLSEWEKKRFELFGCVEAWNLPGTEQTVDHFQECWRDELMVFHQKKNLITINGCYLHSLQWSRWRGAKVKGKRKMATRTEDWWHRSKEKIWLQMGECKDKGYIPMHVCLAHTCRVWEEVTISAKNLLNTKTKHKVTDFRSCMNCFKPYERETLGDITISWCMWATTCTAVCLPTPLRPARRIEPPRLGQQAIHSWNVIKHFLKEEHVQLAVFPRCHTQPRKRRQTKKNRIEPNQHLNRENAEKWSIQHILAHLSNWKRFSNTEAQAWISGKRFGQYLHDIVWKFNKTFIFKTFRGVVPTTHSFFEQRTIRDEKLSSRVVLMLKLLIWKGMQVPFLFALFSRTNRRKNRAGRHRSLLTIAGHSFLQHLLQILSSKFSHRPPTWRQTAMHTSFTTSSPRHKVGLAGNDFWEIRRPIWPQHSCQKSVKLIAMFANKSIPEQTTCFIWPHLSKKKKSTPWPLQN